MTFSRKPQFYSPSRLKRYLLCPAESVVERTGGDTPAQAQGHERHEDLFNYYWLGNHVASLVNADVKRAIETPGFLPSRNDIRVVSCEAEGIPPEFQAEKYGRKLSRATLGLDWGIECAADLAYELPGDESTLIIADYKGRAEDDHTIQATCNAVVHLMMYPQYTTVCFEALYIPTLRCDRDYVFTRSCLDEYVHGLETIVRQIQNDTDRMPRLNQYCSSCGIRNACAEYRAGASGAVVAQNAALTMPLSQLLDYRERLGAADKIVKAEQDKVRDRLMRELDTPAVVDGRLWYVAEQGGRYTLDQNLARMACEELGVDLHTVASVDPDKYEQATFDYVAQIKDPAMAAAARKALEAAWTQSRYKTIRSKAAKEVKA